MTETVYIIFTRNGIDRMVKRQPDYTASEYPVAVTLTIPADVFKRRPIPVVEIALKGQKVGAAEVIVDGESQDVSPNMDEAALKQAVVQHEFAALFERARVSSDPAMVEVAGLALDALLAAGVEVRITDGQAEQGQAERGQAETNEVPE